MAQTVLDAVDIDRVRNASAVLAEDAHRRAGGRHVQGDVQWFGGKVR